ncbi:MAG: hypothetical protein J6U01_12730 [Clostridia bacterium]|nr:hypothetical protein [Clostridia bacterium]
MKRWICAATAVMMVLFTVCLAAAEGVTFTTKYFTMQLPEGWETDFEDLTNEDGVEELGYFGEPAAYGLTGGSFLVYYEEMKDFRLFDASQEEMQAYIDALMEEYKDDHPVYLDTVMADKIPLVMFRCTDQDGEYILIDTMTNGYAIEIQFYVMSDDEKDEKTYPVTDRQLELIKSVLATFRPAGA